MGRHRTSVSVHVCVFTCWAWGLLENEDDDVPCIFLALKLLYFSLCSLTHTHTHTQPRVSCISPCFYSFETVTAPFDNSSNAPSCSALDRNFMLVSGLICCLKEHVMLSYPLRSLHDVDSWTCAAGSQLVRRYSEPFKANMPFNKR